MIDHRSIFEWPNPALQLISTISPGTGFTWRLTEISLKPVDSNVWVWQAHYSQALARPSNEFRGSLSSMDVFVLMDGTVPKPRVTYGKQP